MRPLLRIRSISAADLQTIAISMLDHIKQLSGNFADRQIAIHRHQSPFMLIVLRDGPSLKVIRLETFPDHFLAIVAADNQRRTVNVAEVADARWLEIDVIDVSVGETGPASSEPLYQLIIIHIDADHNRQTEPVSVRFLKDLALKKSSQPARLPRGAREAIKNEAPFAIDIPQPVGYHLTNQIIRNQFAASNNLFGLFPQLGPTLHVRSQDVSGGDLRDAIVFGNPLRLCALARAWRSKQHNRADVL